MLDRPITKQTDPQKWYADKYENDKNGNKWNRKKIAQRSQSILTFR
jgi:hypothetical protein